MDDFERAERRLIERDRVAGLWRTEDIIDLAMERWDEIERLTAENLSLKAGVCRADIKCDQLADLLERWLALDGDTQDIAALIDETRAALQPTSPTIRGLRADRRIV